jgi:hypothetical protein
MWVETQSRPLRNENLVSISNIAIACKGGADMGNEKLTRETFAYEEPDSVVSISFVVNFNTLALYKGTECLCFAVFRII